MITNNRATPVKQYHLSGGDMRIVFHNGEGDDMTLEYNGKLFKGRALYREQTVLGLIVSVMLESVPDMRTVFLSLAVPAANCPPPAESTHVSTFAVFTTGRDSIGGPALLSGQLQDYKIVPLAGSAW